MLYCDFNIPKIKHQDECQLPLIPMTNIDIYIYIDIYIILHIIFKLYVILYIYMYIYNTTTYIQSLQCIMYNTSFYGG